MIKCALSTTAQGFLIMNKFEIQALNSFSGFNDFFDFDCVPALTEFSATNEMETEECVQTNPGRCRNLSPRLWRLSAKESSLPKVLGADYE